MIFGISRAVLGIALLCAMLAVTGYSYLSNAKSDATVARDASMLRAEGLRKNIAQLKQEVVAAQNSEAASVLMWRSPEGATPAGAVQRAIGSEVAAANATLISMSGVADTTIGTLPSVQLLLEGEADLAQWQALMKKLSDYRPALLVSDAELRRVNRLGEGTQPVVLFRMTVNAPYMVQEG